MGETAVPLYALPAFQARSNNHHLPNFDSRRQVCQTRPRHLVSKRSTVLLPKVSSRDMHRRSR
jgi:hypothetical protein